MQTLTESFYKWRAVFLICLGVFAGTAFCMKWMEKDFIHDGSLFTIIGLEISYPKEQLRSVLAGIDDHVRSILRYHLVFDFAFMAGVYPGIASLCMMARYKVHGQLLKQFLLWLALLQALAFCCDIVENCLLLKWVNAPGSISHFELYHWVVILKWSLALAGALLAIPLCTRKSKQDQQRV